MRRSRAGRKKVSQFGQYSGYSEAIYDGYQRRSQHLVLEDGTRLAYDLLLPTKDGVPAEGLLPTLFKYTPYLRAFTIYGADGNLLLDDLYELKWYERAALRVRYMLSDQGHLMDAVANTGWLKNMIHHGYAVIVVERPGTGASFGRMDPSFEVGARQADEIITWIAAQDWCDGNIGMFGDSWQAMIQFAAASTGNPHLKAIFPVSSSLDSYSAVNYRGGVYNDTFNTLFSQSTGALEALATPVDGDESGALLAQARAERSGATVGEKSTEVIKRYPFHDSTTPDGKNIWEGDFALYPFIDRINGAGVPIYMTNGWYDLFTSDMFLWYANLTVPRRLVVRPLDHSQVEDDGADLGFGAEVHRWFDFWLKSIENGIMEEPPISYYTMGAPEDDPWQTSDEWPLSGRKVTLFYLREGNSGTVDSANDGCLNREPPTAATAHDTYTLDYSTTSGRQSHSRHRSLCRCWQFWHARPGSASGAHTTAECPVSVIRRIALGSSSRFCQSAAARRLRRRNMENTTIIPKRSAATFVVIAMLLTLLLACGSNEAVITVPAGAQAGDLVGLEPCAYEANKVEYDADCGTLVVPENRGDPDSRLIALPVIRVRATGDDPAEPIFYFSGGPGQSNLHSQHVEDVIEKHDFVEVGYRGVDGSVVLDCPEISEAIRTARALLSDKALESYTSAGTSCAGRLQAEGVDLAGYTLAETIDDNEDARLALGYGRVNLLAGSYGTRLAMIYEWMYPDSLHRVVMLAVNPPGHFAWDAEVIDEQIEEYARLCAQDAECSARTDDLVASMRRLSEDMPHRWLFIPIDEDAIKLLTLVMLFESVQPPGMPVPLSGPAAVDMWLAAEGGDASGMALASMSRDLFLPTLWIWGEGLSLAASVDDYYDPARDYRSEFEAPDTIFGSPMSLMLWSMGPEWPTHPIPQEYLQVQPTDVETLLISGSIDFSTPPQFATEELLPYLSNGEQVILNDFGHTSSFWNSQPEARVHMLNTFYDTGQVDASPYTYQPLDFDVGLGWPALAKLLVAVVVVVPIMLIVLIWWIIRWLKQRRASQISGRQTLESGGEAHLSS